MIIVKNRKLLIPIDERYIGTTADSNSEVRTFQIDRYSQNETDLSGFTAKADIYHCDTRTTDRADLEMEVQDEYILLKLYITSGMVATPGSLLIDIKLFNDDGTVKWSSYKGAFFVEDPLVTPSATAENLTELEQLEARINRAIATAYEKAAEVVGDWLEENIGEIEGYVIDKSLSVSDAAADAKVVGSMLKHLGYYDGITITTGNYINEENAETTYYLVTIPPADSDGDAIPIKAAYDPDTTPLTHAQAEHTTLTTNTSLELRTSLPGVISDGEVIRASAWNQTAQYPYVVYVGFDEDRVPHEYPIDTPLQTMISAGIKEATVAYYRLVTNGAARDVSNIGLSAAQLRVNPRIAMFVKSDNSLCFLVCDGRDGSNEGMTPSELAELMVENGAVQGWNLDGGGSTSIVTKGSKLNRNIDGNGTVDRKVEVTWNVPHKYANPSVQDAFVKTGIEKQRLVQQLMQTMHTNSMVVVNNQAMTSLTDGMYYINNATDAPTAIDDGYVWVLEKYVSNVGLKKIFWMPYAANTVWCNTYTGTTWTGWTAIDVEYGLLRQGTRIPSGADLHDYITPGTYYIANATDAAAIANSPVAIAAKVVVELINGANVVKQTVTDARGNAYFSSCTEGTWTAWLNLNISKGLTATVPAGGKIRIGGLEYTRGLIIVSGTGANAWGRCVWVQHNTGNVHLMSVESGSATTIALSSDSKSIEITNGYSASTQTAVITLFGANAQVFDITVTTV